MIINPITTIGLSAPCVTRQYILPVANALLYGSIVLSEERGVPQCGQKCTSLGTIRPQPIQVINSSSSNSFSGASGIMHRSCRTLHHLIQQPPAPLPDRPSVLP